jgi:lysophospholipase L1-like esterase
MGGIIKQLLRGIASGSQAAVSEVDSAYWLNGGFQQDPATTPAADLNSVIPGDITLPEWTNSQCLTQLNTGTTDAGVYMDAVTLIRTSGTGLISCIFVAVATSMTLSVPASEPSNKAIKLTFYASDLSTPTFTSRPTLTTSEAAYTLTAMGLVVGTAYKVSIEVHDASQDARPVIGRVRLSPVNGSGIWAENFLRYRVTPNLLGDTSIRSTWSTGQYLQHTSLANVQMLTDADSLTAEVWIDNAAVGFGRIASLLNNREFAQGPTFTTGRPIMDTHTFTDVVTAMRPVTFQADGQDTAVGPLGATPSGVFFRAIYAKQRHGVIFRPALSANRLLIIGDSISMGYSATNRFFHGAHQKIRRRYPGVACVDAYGGRQFKTDGDTTAKQQNLAAWIAQGCFTDIYIALGVVDYISALWTAAAYGTGYAAFLDFAHAASPQARIYSQSPIPKTSEVANGLGDTLGAFRTQIQTAATNASRVPWSIFVDGTGALFPTTGDLSVDGIHPSDVGYAKLGAGAIAAMVTAGAL